MNCALMVAPEIALSAANARSKSASGSMNDTSMSEPTASTSKMTRSLMADPRGRSRRGGQLDPDAADRVQVQRPLGVLAELAPEPGDMHVDGLIGAAIRHLPDVGQQISLGDYLAGSYRQVVQQVELPSGQIEWPTVEPRLVRLAIEPQPSDDDSFASPVLVDRSPQHRPDPGLDLVSAERLDQVIIGAGVEHAHDIGVLVACRGHHHRDLADRPHHPQRLVAVHIWQAEIEYYQVRWRVEDKLQRLHGSRRARYGVPALAERTNESAADGGVVFNEQELRHA